MAKARKDIVPPYIPFYWADYLKDDKVQAMSTLGQGAFIRLLLHAWGSSPPCTVPDDDGQLSRLAGVTALEWESIKNTVMAPWSKYRGRWRQNRLWREFSKSKKLLIQYRERACKAANRRWRNDSNDSGLNDEDKHSSSNASLCLPHASKSKSKSNKESGSRPSESRIRETARAQNSRGKSHAKPTDSDSEKINLRQDSDSGFGIRETDKALLAIMRSLGIESPAILGLKRLDKSKREQAQANWTDWKHNIEPAVRRGLDVKPIDWFVMQAAEAKEARKPPAAFRKRLGEAGIAVGSLNAIDREMRAKA